MRRAFLGFALLSLGACIMPSDADDPSYGLGTPPDAAQLAAMDTDVDPRGHGLPPGEGTVSQGAVVYAAQCASCHGARGEGRSPSPALVGRTPAAGHVFALDNKAPRTIGNYWPYATTVFDYVQRAMPLSTPGTLTATETYSVVAYLLSENGIITPDAVMNAQTLPAVVMPAAKFFVRDNRTGGRLFR
jgi:S-disulfanyl-L-cysteine oxidoreductase SoxD